MSLIVQLSQWSKKTATNWFIFIVSTCIITCIFWLILPTIFGRRNVISSKSTRTRDTRNTQQSLSREISRQIEDTKLRLIFRTHTDLSDRLDIPQQDIILHEVKDKTWTDTGLECPEPYRNIKPLVEIPQRTNLQGWIILWKLGNDMFEYNTSIRGDWVLCSKIEIPEDIAEYRSPADR